MDLSSKESGLTRDYFWCRSKLDLIDILFNKICQNGASLPEKRILNIGVGTGDDLSLMHKYGEIYAIDNNIEAIETLPTDKCHEKKVCNACDINYPDNYFDIAVAFDVLEYIDDDRKAVEEIHRVLKPEGYFIFTVPALPVLYSAHDKYFNHKRRYSMRYIKKILSILECNAIGYWMFFLFLPICYKKLTNRKGAKLVYTPLPKKINEICYKICGIDTWLIKKNIRLPIGTTIHGIYKKKGCAV